MNRRHSKVSHLLSIFAAAVMLIACNQSAHHQEVDDRALRARLPVPNASLLAKLHQQEASPRPAPSWFTPKPGGSGIRLTYAVLDYGKLGQPRLTAREVAQMRGDLHEVRGCQRRLLRYAVVDDGTMVMFLKCERLQAHTSFHTYSAAIMRSTSPTARHMLL